LHDTAGASYQEIQQALQQLEADLDAALAAAPANPPANPPTNPPAPPANPPPGPNGAQGVRTRINPEENARGEYDANFPPLDENAARALPKNKQRSIIMGNTRPGEVRHPRPWRGGKTRKATKNRKVKKSRKVKNAKKTQRGGYRAVYPRRYTRKTTSSA
jgi:hypothetical protein